MKDFPAIEPDTVFTVVPHDLAVSGGSIARHEGLVVFLDGGLPGETVRARVTRQKKRFVEAVVEETILPSPDAVPSHCQHGSLCGGCAWTTLSYEAQCAWKERQVKETLRRLGSVAFADATPTEAGAVYDGLLASPKQLAYRNKVEFAFGTGEQGPALGMKRRGSHEIIPVATCPLAASPLGDVLAAVRAWMQEENHPVYGNRQGFLRFLVVRCPEHALKGSGQLLVELITAPTKPNSNAAASVQALGTRLLREGLATGFAHSLRSAASDIAYGERILYETGSKTVIEAVGNTLLEAPPQAFMQVNTPAAALLYARIQEMAEACAPSTVWDLYSGVGGIALALAAPGRTVTGIENVAEAVAWARRNAHNAAGTVSFRHVDAEKQMAREQTPPDLVVFDPPRAGIAGSIVDALLRLRPRNIISVSCDTASQARDIARLAPLYTVERAGAVDLFPHTPHVESYALLTRRTA